MTYLYESLKRPTRLYIKQCPHCYMKYFGKTHYENIERYSGSGKRWLNHLKKHQVTPLHLWHSKWYTDTSISRFALLFSRLNKIVESDIWANLKEENGLDGGSMTMGKIWMTNGHDDILVSNDTFIPTNFRRGRSHCVFNDVTTQKELSSRVDIEKRKESLKRAWREGKFDKRDSSRLGGNKHTEATKRNLSIMAQKREKIECPHCGKLCQPGMAKRWHFDNCRGLI